MKLGKLAPKHDPRTLRLARYITPELPPPPIEVDYAAGVQHWPMFRNDVLGDCTCATAGHMVQAWTQQSRGDDVVLTDDEIVAAYREISGYDPDDPETDRGAYVLDVLKYWRSVGIGWCPRQIGAFAAVDPDHREHVQQSVHLFGGLYLGVALPISAQEQAVWDVTGSLFFGDSRPGSWGGHAVNVVGYDADAVTIVTWGALKRVTWRFFDAYVDEAYAIIAADWFRRDTLLCPAGFALADLASDLRHVAA